MFCSTVFLPDCRLESRRVYGCSTHTNVFGEGWLLLSLRLESRRVDGGADFLAVAWLELGSVLTFSYVELRVLVSGAALFNVNVNFSVVTSATREVDFDVSICLAASWSEEEKKSVDEEMK